MAVRNIFCLPALVGSWRYPGGGAVLSTSGFFKYDYAALERPDLIRGNPRTINMSCLGEALTRSGSAGARAGRLQQQSGRGCSEPAASAGRA